MRSSSQISMEQMIMSTVQSKGFNVSLKKPAIFQCPYFSSYRGKISGQTKIIKMFNKQILTKLDLVDDIEFNEAIMTSVEEYLFSEYFSPIQYVVTADENYMFVSANYEHRLNQFLLQKKLSEKQALIIFEQVLKAIFALTQENYIHQDIRADHFIFNENKNVWQLQSLVLRAQEHQKENQSVYTSCSEYSPPQVYEKSQFTEGELTERLVWNLGCLLIQLLLGTHKLKNEDILYKFKGEPFSFSKIGINQRITSEFSGKIKQLLSKMCHHDYKKRMKLSELFQQKFFSHEISTYLLQKKNKQKKNPSAPSSQQEKPSQMWSQITKNNISQQKEEEDDKKRNSEVEKSQMNMYELRAKIRSKIETDQPPKQQESNISFGDNLYAKDIEKRTQKQNNPEHEHERKYSDLSTIKPEPPNFKESLINIILRTSFNINNNNNNNNQVNNSNNNLSLSLGPQQKIAKIYSTHLGKCQQMCLSNEMLEKIHAAITKNPLLLINRYSLNHEEFIKEQLWHGCIYIIGYKFLSTLLKMNFLIHLDYQNFYNQILRNYREKELTQSEMNKFFNESGVYEELKKHKERLQKQSLIELQGYADRLEIIFREIQKIRKIFGKDVGGDLQNQLKNLIDYDFEEVFVNKKFQILYVNFKNVYRKIIFKLYNEAQRQYMENSKVLVWAQIASKLTFCFSIDKVFKPSDIEENFKLIMTATGGDSSKWLVLPDNIEKFFKSDKKTFLAKFSKYLLTKYYQVHRGKME